MDAPILLGMTPIGHRDGVMLAEVYDSVLEVYWYQAGDKGTIQGFLQASAVKPLKQYVDADSMFNRRF